MGVLVMFMAPGSAMLEAGMVRAEDSTEILTQNVALLTIARGMYLLVGDSNMCADGSGFFLPDFWRFSRSVL